LRTLSVALSITAAPPGVLPGLLVALGTGLLAGLVVALEAVLLAGELARLVAKLITTIGNPAAAGAGWGAMTGRPRRSI
jgi:hypothetical protein